MLRRVGLKDVSSVPMSDFYHEAKETYLSKLAETRNRNHDLTPFLNFALNGVEAEVSRLTQMLRHEVSREMFRNFVNELLVRLARTRKRVIIKRQLSLLGHLLDKDQEMDLLTLATDLRDHFSSRKRPLEALARDIVRLEARGAVRITPATNGVKRSFMVSVNLDWPGSMTETDFFRQVSELPKSKKYSLLTNSTGPDATVWLRTTRSRPRVRLGLEARSRPPARPLRSAEPSAGRERSVPCPCRTRSTSQSGSS